MKSVLLSIQPKWCELILNGKKTVEIRKSAPAIEFPFKCYIYCTQGSLKDLSVIGDDIYQKRMKVIAEFTCSDIFPIHIFENGTIQDYNWHQMDRSCVNYDAIANYIRLNKTGYGWEISDLIIYNEPKELEEFCRYGYINAKYNSIWHTEFKDWTVNRPPQSYMFVEDLASIYSESAEAIKLTQDEILIKEYESFDDASKRLNYYRNLHYKDSYGESSIVAWALDEILPELYRLRKEKEND